MSQKREYALTKDWARKDAVTTVERSPELLASYLPPFHRSPPQPTHQNEMMFGDLNTAISEEARIPLSGTGMTQTLRPGPLGQALHLVILLNDLVDPEEGPDDTQQAERIDLEDDLVELLEAMEEWGAGGEEGGSVDHEQRLLKIQHHYTRIFKDRFYFHDIRDATSDPIYQKLVAYDERTIETRRRCQVESPIVEVEYWIGQEESHVESVEDPDGYPEVFESSAITTQFGLPTGNMLANAGNSQPQQVNDKGHPIIAADDGGPKKPNFKSLFHRKQGPGSIHSSSSFSSFVSTSGSSNAASTFGGWRDVRRSQARFGSLAEEDEMPMSTQTRHGIRQHAHAAADVPYPISFEEMVLQGEKHTQELLSTVLQQKAYHFTPMDNFSKLKNILDVGCGRGYWLSDAAKECKNANLFGFDIVDVFLTPQELRDRRGLNDVQISRIKFRQGNFLETLPFQAGEFDYIRLAFLELAIPESKWVPLLKEAWRILKPGGHIEVVIESQLFPTVWSYDKLPVQQELEDEFRGMLEARDIPPATNIGEKMFFDAFARVQTHQHVSVCIAPRPAGRSSHDGLGIPLNFGSVRSMDSPSSRSREPVISSDMISSVSFRRVDRTRPSFDVLPPQGHLVTSKTCTVPGIVISRDTFIPVPEETLFTHANHSAMVLNAARLTAFSDKYPDASPDEHEEWQAHVERYWQYERSNRLRLGFRMKQFDDDDEDDEIPDLGPTTGRWKWARCDEDLERPLEIRRFRAWSLSKPLGLR